jgi:hypothetical protein
MCASKLNLYIFQILSHNNEPFRLTERMQYEVVELEGINLGLKFPVFFPVTRENGSSLGARLTPPSRRSSARSSVQPRA